MAGLEFADERKAIEYEVEAAWAVLGDPAPIAYDNVRFTEPKPDDTVPRWLRLVIIPSEADQIGLGTKPCHRLPGQIVAQLFAVEKRGSAGIRTLGDQFLGIFLDANGRPREFSRGSSGRIQTHTGWLTRDGIMNGWYQMRAIVPFIRDVRF